jgi:hypothetical protein
LSPLFLLVGERRPSSSQVGPPSRLNSERKRYCIGREIKRSKSFPLLDSVVQQAAAEMQSNREVPGKRGQLNRRSSCPPSYICPEPPDSVLSRWPRQPFVSSECLECDGRLCPSVTSHRRQVSPLCPSLAILGPEMPVTLGRTKKARQPGSCGINRDLTTGRSISA